MPCCNAVLREGEWDGPPVDEAEEHGEGGGREVRVLVHGRGTDTCYARFGGDEADFEGEVALRGLNQDLVRGIGVGLLTGAGGSASPANMVTMEEHPIALFFSQLA